MNKKLMLKGLRPLQAFTQGIYGKWLRQDKKLLHFAFVCVLYAHGTG
jgi:hypothetical protein